MADHYALIMAGGGGTRLWPASTPERPKQILAGLAGGDRSLVVATVERVEALIPRERIFAITTVEQAAGLRAAMPMIDPRNVLEEPSPRNTAPAVGLALSLMRARIGPVLDDAVVVALPADHHVANEPAFRDDLRGALEHAARTRTIVTLGIEPTRPDTGYGYIERTDQILAENPTVHRAAAFHEKPDQDTATRYLADGRYLWNAGIFALPVDTARAAYREHTPVTADALAEIDRALEAGEDLVAAARRAYEAVLREPIDIAIMEKLAELAVVPSDCGWSDLGSWQAVAEMLDHDGKGNAIAGKGRSVVVDAHDCLVWNESGSVGVLGVSGIAVIVSEGRVLVCPIDRAQDVRKIVDALDE